MSNPLPAGTTLTSLNGRRYRITATLGQGGFGITYKATTTVQVKNIRAEATCAIKELFIADDCERSSDSGDTTVRTSGGASRRMAAALKDFMAEARRLGSIAGRNPNIVNVNEVFEANGTAYYVMEFLDGSSLRDYVNRHGALSESDALRLMIPIIRAVEFLHSERITHLDIKPGNIMLDTSDGAMRPVLIDFGQSKHYGADGSVTCTVSAAGFSDGYAPIEQYAGIAGFSPTADIYALAATLLFCLTGVKPPRSAEISAAYIEKALPKTVTQQTRSAIIKAMSLDPANRQQSAQQLLSDLTDDATIKEEVKPKPEPKPKPKPEPEPDAKTPAWAKWIIAISAVFLVWVIMYIAYVQHNESKKSESVIDSLVAPEVEEVVEEVVDTMSAVPSLNDYDNPVMQTYDLSGNFSDSQGREWPVKLVFSTNGKGRFGRATYTNVTYGVVLTMEGSGTDGSYSFYTNEQGADLTINIRHDGYEWVGTATNGNKTLSVTLY